MGITGKDVLRSLLLAGVLLVTVDDMSVGAQTRAGQATAEGTGRVTAAAAEQLFALANRSRAESNAGRLAWDPALADAARQHCLRMVAEGPIAHRYDDEPSVAQRAAQAGAHFSLIEENVALGPTPEEIHDGWMHSPGHCTNLLNPSVDRVGIAVVASRGELYAVADYARGAQALPQAQVEARIAALIRPSGVAVIDPTQARAACTTDHGIPASPGGPEAQFVMRWQGADLSQLPQQLVEKLASGQFRKASVGSCPARGGEADFTAYRVAVLLY